SDDAPAVFDLFQRWPGHAKQEFLDGFPDWREHVVAEADGEIIGYAGVTPSGWDANHFPATRAMGGNWGFLADLVVSEPMRSRGVGARLVVAAEEVARAAGARGLAVDTDATGDRERLCRFYESLAYEPVWPHGEPVGSDTPYYFRRF
ncbi:GNAT family N-acetyltransferase, partial [Brachybacterium tyrofermentans]|uniref:GNAT family N-acetyltransferase n=1 Tax=Brachybacterium tyrofermentans TaxID=47848 RepID=UPI003FD23FCD